MVRNFIHDESGIETMEWIAILAVSAVLIAIAAAIATKMQAGLKNAADHI